MFGISPDLEPNNPSIATTTFDQYDMLFADARKWIRRGWADYFSLNYTGLLIILIGFPVLLDWWKLNNKKNNFSGGNKTDNYKDENQIKEVTNQIMIIRSIVKKILNRFVIMI